MSGKSSVDRVKRATRTVSLYVGGDLDLLDEYERLQATQPKTLAGTDRARLDEIRSELQADTMQFRFQALGRRSLQKLLDTYPPREGKVRDQGLGFNEDEATAALIRKCLVDPDLPEKALDDLLDEQLTEGDYEKLSATVWALNRRSADLPLSLTVSTPPRSTGDA